MATEIERKFLIDRTLFNKFMLDSNTKFDSVSFITQTYLSEGNFVSRVRTRSYFVEGLGPSEREQAFLTFKGKGLLMRKEYEFRIPLFVAKILHALGKKKIAKMRYVMGRWELDEFFSAFCKIPNLLMAEIELSDPNEHYDALPFLLEEVTDEKLYSNVNLAVNKD